MSEANAYASKPWLALYTPGLPHEIEAAYKDALSLFRAAVARAKRDQPAILGVGQRDARFADDAQIFGLPTLEAFDLGRGHKCALVFLRPSCRIACRQIRDHHSGQ